jgi:hypothetical protein
MSTTQVLRWAHAQTDGNVRAAMRLLGYKSPAFRVLARKLRIYPNATTFHFQADGFITVK